MLLVLLLEDYKAQALARIEAVTLPAALREQYEVQACACLEAGARHQPRLLAVARKLTGSAEGGMDLFQQALLNCHDAIQRKGFEGDRYEFYLLASLKNLYYHRQK